MELIDLGPQRVCPCGSECFKILVTFDEDNTIGSYIEEMYCEACGSHLTAPMPGVNC